MSKQLAQGAVETFKTIALTSLGTAALVGAHHLGRRQYDANARLKDYTDGVADTWKRLRHKNASQNVSPMNTDYTTLAPHWVSGVADLQSQSFAVVGIDATRQMVWQTLLPERVHDILVQPYPLMNSNNHQPHRHVVVMGRRPSEFFWVLDVENGDIIHHIKADKDRHFYGHACYSLDGKTLYITENNTQNFAGVIGVYDVATGYKKISEFATQGIGPHELIMHPDGDTLVVANGGIKTEKASREELNLESMQPSLVYLNRHSGELLEQVYPEHNQMSVRHLDIHENGTVAIGIQFQGERHLSVPLLLTHQRGQSAFNSLKLPESDRKGWHRFHQYIASVAVDSKHNLLCATSPLGGCAAVFDLCTGFMIGETELPDCAGVAVWGSDNQVETEQEVNHKAESTTQLSQPRFLVSDGQGYLTQIGVNVVSNSLVIQKKHLKLAFDNHLTQIDAL